MFRVALVSLLVFSRPLIAWAWPTEPQRSSGVPQYFAAFASKEDKDRTTLAKLRNGLSVVVEEESLLPLASLVTYVKADHSQKKNAEAARFYEFLLEAISSYPFEARKLGGTFEVTTKLDHVLISTLVPPEELSDAMQIHARALALKELSRKQLENALELFKASQKAHVLTLEERDRRRVWEMAYPDREASVASLELEEVSSGFDQTSLSDLESYRSTFYKPERVIISVSGAVFRENVLRKTAELFAGVKGPSSGENRRSSPEKPGLAPIRFAYQFIREDRPVHAVRFGFRVPDSVDPDFFSIRVLAVLLGSGRGSLLGRYAMETGALLHWDVKLSPVPGGGLLEVSLQPDPAHLDSVEIEVLALLAALARKGPTPADLDRARAMLTKEWYQSQETLQARAYGMARWQAVDRYTKRDEVPGLIQSVSSERVRVVAEKYFGESRACLLELFPLGAENREFTSETFWATLQLLLPPRVEKIIEELDSIRSLQPEPSFSIAEFSPKLVRYDLKKTSILRGPEIYLEERHLVPVVHVGFFLPGGRLDEEEGNAGITEIMLESILQRHITREGEMAWLEFEKMGGEVEIVNEPDFFGLQVSVLSPHLNSVIGHFQQFFVPEGLADPEVSKSRDRVLSKATSLEGDPSAKVRRELREKLFRGHPYAFSRWGTEKSLSTQDVQTVWAWTRKQLEPFHPMIIICGDVAGTSFLPPMIQTLSNSKFKAKEKIAKSPGRDVADAAWASSSGFVGVGFQGPVLGSRDAWVLDLLRQLACLMQEKTVVEERLWQKTFARVHFESQIYQNAGGVYLDLRVAAGDEQEALTILERGLNRFNTTIVRREDLLGSIVATITSFYAGQQDGRTYTLTLANDFLAGETTGYQSEYLTTIKGVDLEEVRTLGTRLLRVSELSLPARETN